MKIRGLLHTITLAPAAYAVVRIEEARAAGIGGGGTLPVDPWFQAYTGEISGPAALAVGITMLVGAGVHWHRHGHDMGSGLLTVIGVGVALSMIGGAKTWYQSAAAAGALI